MSQNGKENGNSSGMKPMYAEAVSTDSTMLDPRDPEDFTRLVEQHHRELLVYARALTRDVNTAREVVQDAFVQAYQKIGTFDVTRDFAAWMRGIIRNKWREWLRRNRRHKISDPELATTDAMVALWQSRKATGGYPVFDALEQCLERLPDNLRTAVNACYYRGETSEEAAVSLGVAPAAIRKRLQRARDLLRDCIEKKMSQSTHE